MGTSSTSRSLPSPWAPAPREALQGALSFAGEGRRAFRGLLGQLGPGGIERLAFAVPGGTLWALPLYELALMTATYAARAGSTACRSRS